MNFFIVGGTFDNTGGKSSGLIGKLSRAIENHLDTKDKIRIINGGNYEIISDLLNDCSKYDIILWMANVPNDLPKIRNVKDVAPRSIYINSKRNDNNKYTMQELVNKSLGVKANLTIEFSKQSDGVFNMLLFDPLGTAWYDGTDIDNLSIAIIKRAKFLTTVTRESTKTSDIAYDNNLITIRDTDEHAEFVNLVKEYANVFHDVIQPAKEVTRFLGNASMRSDLSNFRCTKGFPTFRADNMIFVSRRNVDKQTLSLQDFVPVYFDDNKTLRYIGDNKPSVDTPIQIRLYSMLPNINYMIHSHCYIKNAPFTLTPIPCGGLEEVQEIIETLNREYKDLNKTAYMINLKGHGNIIMGNSINDLRNIDFIGRPIPELV